MRWFVALLKLRSKAYDLSIKSIRIAFKSLPPIHQPKFAIKHKDEK